MTQARHPAFIATSTQLLRSWTPVWVACLVLLLGLGAPAAVAQSTDTSQGGGESVDLELVLAVDTSSSVSKDEFDLQMRGLAAAFRDPRVMGAIRASGDLGLAVSLVQWSDSRKQFIAVDWTVVRDQEAAQGFSENIEGTPRFLVGGGTAIGSALRYAVRQFDDNGFTGRRRVIDISGDGRANQGADPAQRRDDAVAQGITINGLAILNEDPVVDRYYSKNVIGGTGAFVMSANDYESYALAILIKLIREISGAPIAALPGAGPTELAIKPE